MLPLVLLAAGSSAYACGSAWNVLFPDPFESVGTVAIEDIMPEGYKAVSTPGVGPGFKVVPIDE